MSVCTTARIEEPNEEKENPLLHILHMTAILCISILVSHHFLDLETKSFNVSVYVTDTMPNASPNFVHMRVHHSLLTCTVIKTMVPDQDAGISRTSIWRLFHLYTATSMKVADITFLGTKTSDMLHSTILTLPSKLEHFCVAGHLAHEQKFLLQVAF